MLLSNISDTRVQDALLGVLEKKLWGGLYDQRQALPMRLGLSIEKQPRSSLTTIYACLAIQEHWRDDALAGGMKRVAIRSTMVSYQHSVSDHELRSFANGVEKLLDLVINHMVSSASDLALRVFEADPRYGYQHYIDPKTRPPSRFDFPVLSPPPVVLGMPPCPLFDPRGGVQIPTPNLPYRPLPPSFSELWSVCGRCGEDFMFGDTVTWVGGNLRWLGSNCCR